jgi:pimeloyl-ACP methyl ester carboxylesterase
MTTFVLVHGAWHSGDLFEGVAERIRAAGHTVYCPTLAGNRPGDRKDTGLDQAIQSLVDYFSEHQISDAVLLGHSYGGMVITGAADRLPGGSVRRLVYWSAYVPSDGESLEDISPPFVRERNESLRQPDGSVGIGFTAWRDNLMNDSDIEAARYWYEKLNPHPHNTLRDKIKLKRNPSEMEMGKSYIHCLEDMCYPQSNGGWHPGQSERLGAFRYVAMMGGHEVCFTNPSLLAEKIIIAGRD